MTIAELQKLIEQAERENWDELDLRGLKLYELPSVIGQLHHLTVLKLGYNQETRRYNYLTTLPDTIAMLENLQTLDLCSNKLSELPERLGQLTNLQTLDLSINNLFKLPGWLGQLTNLQTLTLRSTNLYRLPEWLGLLKNLQTLDLSSNNLSELPEWLGQLTNLQTLDLSSNNLSELPEGLGQLTNLQTLILRNNKLSELPEGFGQLTNLQTLDLRSTYLSELPEWLGQLTNLQTLDLSNNNLFKLPEWLGQLTNLQTLTLRSNNLSELPEGMGQLTNLQTLDLSNNNLFKLPEWLGQLTNLQTLTLRSTYLSELPEGLGQLTNLQTLTLSSNNLFKLPDGLGQLTNLQTLDLSNNNLFKLPKWLGQLTNLQTLDLRSTYLSELPEGLEQLTNLQTLDLRSNNLSVLTVVVGNLPNLHTLYLGENPISDPPLEMLGDALKPNSQTNLDKIRRYFRQLSEAGKAYLYEAKLLIIGEGGAGKTSLACKLKTPDASLCPDEASTEGIDIVNWQFDLSQNHNVDQYHVNIWDFGGQEVYFATHQFFLTKRSVYVLVADTRRQHTDFYNWLRMQEMFGGDSPVILLKNRNRRHGNRFSIENLPQLRERFSNLKEVVELDLDSVPNDAGWTQLLRELEHRFMSLEHIGVARPRTWVQVREYLGDDKRDTITIQDFLEICTDQGIQREADALQFCDYLHHLGDILHFQDDPLLRELVILKPTWGLDAVYRVLDNEKTVENWGQFSYADLFTLWHEPEYAGHQHQLLRLMQNFQLCYQLAGQQDMFIAPQLLHEDVPEYEWEPIDNLQLRYRYPVFMPRGILSRAIVKLHSRIEDQKQVWRSGVILNDGYARAELLELRGESEIRIRISGRHKRDLLMEIVRALDDLHYGFTKLRYEKLIPCNCKACARLTVPHFFRLDKLRGRLANRKRTIECENPPYDDVNIRELIDDFDSVEYDSRRDRFAGGESSNDLETKIGKHFSSDNLKLLCFQLDIDYDNLPGAAKANKVYELIAYCKRRRLTSKLFSGLQKERPNVLWK